MRGALTLLILFAAGTSAEGVREVPLLNVEVVDTHGVQTRLAGFHRISGEDQFRGYLGAGRIMVPYSRVREVRIQSPAHPAGRMRATLTLRSGKEVRATFDEREGEQVLKGFASYGAVTIFFRDVRQLTILGKTSRKDLPAYGPPAAGMDVRVKDRQAVTTELVHFRRAAGENVLPGVRGASSIAIPLRILKLLKLEPPRRTAYMEATATLKDGSTLSFQVPTYAEETVYSGKAEFGSYRIHLGKLRELEIHRVTPILRQLDPLAAAEGKEKKEGRPGR